MEFKIIAPGADEIRLINRLPSAYKGHKLQGARSISAKSHFGKMIFQHFKGKDFDIWYSNYFIDHSTQIIGRADDPIVELHIQFLDQIYTEWDGIISNTHRQYQYNLTYSPHVNNRVKFLGGRNSQTFDIHFSLDLIKEFAKGSTALKKFLEKIKKKEPARISEIDRFLTPEMISIINNILQCDMNDKLNYFYIESNVKLLLTLILDQVAGNHPLAPVKLTDYEIEQLYHARDIILKDFEEELSLSVLSKKVALNEFKLKKGFKYLFGKPVFEYRKIAKLDQAKKMILDTNAPLEDIAYLTGFEHPSNFRKAFKKHFKFTPAELKKFHLKTK